jgi:hypothetical protein
MNKVIKEFREKFVLHNGLTREDFLTKEATIRILNPSYNKP